MDDTASIEELRRRLAETQAALREQETVVAELRAALAAAQGRDAAEPASDLGSLQRLYELNARLANEPDLRVRLEQIVEAANSFLRTDRGCIQLLSADGERLEMFAYRGYEPSSPFIRHFLHEGSKPACDAARQYGRRLIIEDVATFPGLQGTADREVGLEAGIRATQSTPMITRGGEMVGVLSNQFRSPHRPTEDQLRLIDLLAWNAAEIVERQKAESALRDSERRLQRVLETDAVAVLFFDRDGRLTGANDVFLRMTGHSREDVTGGRLTWQQMTPPEWMAESQAQMDRFWAEGRIGPYEKEYLRKDGSRGWMLFTGRDIGDGTIVELGVEITDRKRAEVALQISEERFRVLAESIEDVFYVTDLERGQLEYLSPSFERVWGRSATSLLADLSAFVETVHPDDRQRLAAGKAAQGRGEPTTLEYRIVRPDGTLRWILDRSFVVSGREGRRSAGVASDITEQKQAEARLRESEERQAFLLKLSDALRLHDDPARMQAAAMRLIGERFGAIRAQYYEADADDEHVVGLGGYADGVPPVSERLRIDDFGPFIRTAFRAGRTVVITDALADPRLTETMLGSYRALGIRSGVAVPLLKNQRFVAALGIHNAAPRAWSEQEIALIEEVTERTWAAVERARAEVALRESEERFAQFAGASSGGLWVRDAATLSMEYASPSAGTIYGVAPEALLGPVERWASLVTPDDRDIALGHMDAARGGEAVVHEFRIQRPSDGAFRWIRDKGFPLKANGRIQRIGGIAEDFTEAKLAVEHQGVLLAELQHRVRNIMAMIRSVTTRTGERAASVPDYTSLMLGRLLALARVQALLTRAANLTVGISAVVHDEVSAQAQHEGQYVFEGPEVALSPKAAEVLTLAIHELATNALKYGALSVPDGKVTVTWATVEKRGARWLCFDWTEQGAPARTPPLPAAPRRRGFGTELIEGRVPYELKGSGKVTIEPGGARCHLEFPLAHGASILETGAPQRATVFGGALDMTGEPDLGGRRVLVVEDDYYLASDATRALQGAGAEVMGPCATEADAQAELAERSPDAVVLDINLGRGPSFKLAQLLTDRGIPFVFTTGYDQEVIPAAFDRIERLQKPVELRRIVGAMSRLLNDVS